MKNTHKEINFFDPQITVKKKLVNDKFQYIPGSEIPLPSEVEISESGTCNRKCSFCPRSAPGFKDVKDFISTELIEKLVKELKTYNYKNIIRFSGFVEPLLDKNIFNLLKIIKTDLPEVKIEMVTNGDVLNKKRLLNLYESGLDVLLISVYDGIEDVRKFEKLQKECNILDEQFVIRHRYLPPEDDFGITISNRAGMMEDAEHKIKSTKEPLKDPCYYPSYTFFLDYNGDVLMCPHDWGKKRILGNLKIQTFKEIWTSKFANIGRKLLNKGNRNFTPCNLCDVKGTLIGKKHAETFTNLNEK